MNTPQLSQDEQPLTLMAHLAERDGYFAPQRPSLVVALSLPIFVLVAVVVHGQDFRRQQRQGPPPTPQVTITEERGYRIIRSNGLPDHQPGDFPRPGNPNTISAQRYEFRMTLKPKPAPRPEPAHHAFFAVAVNGVPFEAGTAEFWNREPRSGWNYEALSGKINLGLDDHLAHVQPTGAYHYHGLPAGLVDNLGGDNGQKMLMVGWAADGFPLYTAFAHSDANDAMSPLAEMRSSYHLKQGLRPDGPGGSYDGTYTADYEFVPGSGDLDECNGRIGVTPEYPQGIYYYCITTEFPHLGRLWRGSPDSSFQKQGGPPGGGEPRRGRRGGPGIGSPPPPGMGPGFGPPPPPPPGPGQGLGPPPGTGPGFGPPPGVGRGSARRRDEANGARPKKALPSGYLAPSSPPLCPKTLV